MLRGEDWATVREYEEYFQHVLVVVVVDYKPPSEPAVN